METFQLYNHSLPLLISLFSTHSFPPSISRFHLAHCTKKKDIRATAAVMVLAQRRSNEFLDNDRKHALEALGGRACLETLVNFPLSAAV
jgi:hypothetical protein